MLRIGLTGGIGSGKSTVARIFTVLGIPVYDSDSASKRLMTEDEELKKKIIENFGRESYTDGRLNRKYLSAQVFSDPKKIELLNLIVHPATIKDAALIFESGSNKYLDKVIGVSSPVSLRMERTMKRNNINSQQVKDRMALQMDEEEKMRLCDYVIINDEQQMLIPQVLELHQKFLKGNV
jgi:dephospho-CoA kinase